MSGPADQKMGKTQYKPQEGDLVDEFCRRGPLYIHWDPATCKCGCCGQCCGFCLSCCNCELECCIKCKACCLDCLKCECCDLCIKCKTCECCPCCPINCECCLPCCEKCPVCCRLQLCCACECCECGPECECRPVGCEMCPGPLMGICGICHVSTLRCPTQCPSVCFPLCTPSGPFWCPGGKDENFAGNTFEIGGPSPTEKVPCFGTLLDLCLNQYNLSRSAALDFKGMIPLAPCCPTLFADNGKEADITGVADVQTE